MAVTVLGNIKANERGRASQYLMNSIKYVLNPEKTEENLWMGSNCGTNAMEIYNAMMDTKRSFQKLNGRQGYHFVISFRPGECNETKAYDVVQEFCETYLNGYDYVYTIHNDHEHMHGHIVFNSVGRIDGNKYRYVNGDWEKYIQPITDKICMKYGLEKLEYDRSKGRKGKSYAEHAAEKDGGFSWKKIIRLDIDRAVSISDTFDDYIKEMQLMGYEIRQGESRLHGHYIAYHHGAMNNSGRKSERARRDYRLGDGYTFSDIQERILNKGQYIAADTVYVKEKLHIINEYGKNRRFIVCSVNRYNQAVRMHGYKMDRQEQIRVRKDLLHIGELREECNYLIDNDIGSIAAAKEKLENVRKEIHRLKEFTKTQRYEDEMFSPEENAIRKAYEKMIYRFEHEGHTMSDEEYEKLSDDIETYEKQHEGLMYIEHAVNSGNDLKLKSLMKEKRILMRIVKGAEETMKVRECEVMSDMKRSIVKKTTAEVYR